VQVLLESGEEAANIFRPAKIGDGVGNRVLVFEAQQGRQGWPRHRLNDGTGLSSGVGQCA
jgi:hypothetical protein